MAISVNITADTSEFSRAISKAAHDTQKFDRLNNAAARTFQQLSNVTDKQANTYRSLVNKIQDVESSTSSLSTKQNQLRATGEKLRKLYDELRDKETTEANTLKKLIKQVDKQADSYRKLAKAKENTSKASKGLGSQMLIMSAQFLSVKAVLDTLKGALTANESSFDDFNRLVEQGTSLWNNFLASVGRGSSFTDWAKNLSNVTKQAAKLYDTLDSLGSMKQLNSASIAAIELEIKKLEEEAKLGKAIDKDRLDALKERKKLLKEEMQLQEEAAAKQKIISALSEKGMTSGEATYYANYIINNAKGGGNINSFFNAVRSNANARLQQLGYKETDIKQVLEKNITDPFLKSSKRFLDAEAGVAEGLKYLENSLKDAASNITQDIAVNKWSRKAKDKKIVLDNEDEIVDEYDPRWTYSMEKQLEKIDKDYEDRKTKIRQHNLDIIVSETEFNDAIRERIDELNKSLENKTSDTISYTSSINGSLSSIYDTLQGLGEIENPFQFFDALFGVAQEILSINEALKQLGEISKMTAEAQALSSQKNAAASATEATADTVAATGKTFKAHADIPFVGIAIATAMVGTMIAAMLSAKSKAKSATKFANGGIVGGSSFIGDMNIARVNSGEMILNGSQQKKLFSMLNGNSNIENASLSSNVHFVIKGQDLVGTLDNYNRKIGRVR